MTRRAREDEAARRRRRRMGQVRLFALIAAIAAVAGLLAGTGDDGSTGAGAAAPDVAPPTIPSPGTNAVARRPLDVRLDVLSDPVRVRFKRPPRAALLFDLDTGEVLWRRNPYAERPIASLTKMMTALVIADRLAPGDTVRVTKEALAYRGSGVGILPRGKRIKAETMLHGLLLPSGNDAAIALAQRTAGTTRGFVELMNARAAQMGLTCTRFSSPDGFVDAGNRSCTPDLAAIARALLDEPRLARIVGRRQAALPFPVKGGRLFLYNNNPLIRARYRGAIGVKTGYTQNAGRCIVAAARRGGRRLGVILLHSPDPARQARQLLDRGFKIST